MDAPGYRIILERVHTVIKTWTPLLIYFYSHTSNLLFIAAVFYQTCQPRHALRPMRRTSRFLNVILNLTEAVLGLF